MADNTPVPQAKADIDPVFQTQLEALTRACARAAEFVAQGGIPQWMMPEQLGGWTGDLNDREGMARAFNHDQSDQWYVDATSDAKNPGTTGDLVVATTQIDQLAVMRRAFLARHGYDRRRCLVMMAGRLEGLGSPEGVFAQNIEYINRLLKSSKGSDS